MSNLPNTVNLEANTSGKKDPRKNFTIAEDKQLCHSYLCIALNAIQDYAPEGCIPHNEYSLPACWQIINKGVNKYVSILLAIVHSNSSGTNNEWNEAKADEMYFVETKTKFNLLAASAPNPIGEGIDEEEFLARSAGRKFAKEQEATKRKWEKNIERLIVLHSESIAKGNERKKLLKKTMESNVLVAKAIREKNAILQRTQDIKVLLIDTSLIADPVSCQMMLDLKKKVQERGIVNTPISNNDSMSSNLFDISSKGEDCDGN
ncbi:hypothetical protein PHYBLDRAFT_151282 [Phycomyces blakesleeanus NRRL 1555(-)]|uniref:No apical meristem-associated C-terminal domain-containing protein n=1 Tax=Phycomyces blakesleeanus (strain ATCC 8743b / DSM 1359 / FGSC 10004 / NBRC 33097 / NRRL 1555) TaxID=763407 RepID=A0A162NBR9_PHYB8|nr:hypothetical protein PHYBLDRAFT_151282 [Phycomyces blakesleeanus NRRL 1555(-)]OAD67754.1 hypothetical protein PHYBLDRAFT_151282 [Phycomyces blakesleeanus NRRL 1555(-)]|eukprot:XP_018285794.1 hypothetical protein PHYBLDRAFT_151282 [Phycomyces blakesleeanus NRRL 1555(-)]